MPLLTPYIQDRCHKKRLCLPQQPDDRESPIYKRLTSFVLEPFSIAELKTEANCSMAQPESISSDIRVLPDFFLHTTYTVQLELFLFGDEQIELELMNYEHYVRNIPHCVLSSQLGHKFGIKDQDGDDFFIEL
uniref:Uncharacterized protein n=1 Tax=Moniliophthora roreri TaxID=221103 RepID=A0A0W0G8D6_MONRR